MLSNLSPDEFYRREAERLRTMAASSVFSDVRDDLADMAHHYDVLATQRGARERHGFGRPSAQGALDRHRDNASGRLIRTMLRTRCNMGQTNAPASHAERYRKRAADLRAMAAKAENEAVRDELEVMARQYDRLAESVQGRDAGG